MQMHLVGRTDVFLQRFGWVLPVGGFAAGWTSLILVLRGNEDLARVIAVAVLASWLWLFCQPCVHRKIDGQGGTITASMLAHLILQAVLFFSLPFLLFSTRSTDPGQVLVTGVVVLAAFASTVDSFYEKYIAGRPLPSLAFHGLCSFVAALIVLPIVVEIPPESIFTVALLFVLLWLVFAVPPDVHRDEVSLGAFTLALWFPLLLCGLKSHIPVAGLQVSSSAVTSQVRNHEPLDDLSIVPLSQLQKGLYVHASIKAPLGLSQEVVFKWSHADYSENIKSTITGGREEGYRTYSFKENFLGDAKGHWTVDILTPQGQLLERVEFEVLGAYPWLVQML